MGRRPAPAVEAKVRAGRVRSWLFTAGTFRVEERDGLLERVRGLLLTRTQFAFRLPSPWTRWSFLAGRGGVEWAWVVIYSGMKFSSGKWPGIGVESRSLVVEVSSSSTTYCLILCPSHAVRFVGCLN